MISGKPNKYVHVSEGSGKRLYLNSCPKCATTAFVTLERFPGVVGVMVGTIDDPNWFARTPENAKYIFTSSAQTGTVVQAGYPVFKEHAATLDGTPVPPIVHREHGVVSS